jgi:hypothetical protein
MNRLHRVPALLILAGVLPVLAYAQQAAAPANAQKAPAATATAPVHALTARKSTVHTNPYPYPGYYRNDMSAGFRNPGGVGRYAEYYPPGDKFQNDQTGVQRAPANFDNGEGPPSRQEQLQAQQIGIQRNNALQQHIDNYAAPRFGYGFGVGYFGGAI